MQKLQATIISNVKPPRPTPSVLAAARLPLSWKRTKRRSRRLPMSAASVNWRQQAICIVHASHFCSYHLSDQITKYLFILLFILNFLINSVGRCSAPPCTTISQSSDSLTSMFPRPGKSGPCRGPGCSSPHPSPCLVQSL